MDIQFRKLPVGIQSFPVIIEDNYMYVDKTAYIYRLVHNGSSYFFSRPRRFGKSLLLSTIRAYWEGKKELFAGLEIEKLESRNEKAWQPYPIFYFDFNGVNYKNSNALEEYLDNKMSEWEAYYESEKKTELPGMRFQYLLKTAFRKAGRRCVILVDEYDKPLLETIDDLSLHEHNKNVFKSFFSILKSSDAFVQFVFITGVTKFSKVSIFSDLNQLEDISFDHDYSGICGITEEEVRKYFSPEVEKMAAELDISADECYLRLKKTYDGYRFSPCGTEVYNPYSLFCALKKRRFGSFWFETGTPSFLVKKLREINYDVRQFDEYTVQATETILSDYRIENPDPIPLLYQTGYLTITGISNLDLYTLGFPNTEVRYAFLESLMPEYIDNCGSGSGKDIFTLKRHIETGDINAIQNVLTALFASIPYTGNDAPFEHYFQTVIYIVFTLLGKFTQCEMHTANGRIDSIVETKDFVYIFEFKRDQSAEEALRQIEEKQYAKPYAADSRKVIKIGVNFSSKTREIDDWAVEFL